MLCNLGLVSKQTNNTLGFRGFRQAGEWVGRFRVAVWALLLLSGWEEGGKVYAISWVVLDPSSTHWQTGWSHVAVAAGLRGLCSDP